MWLILTLKMSCFSHQGFLGGGDEGVGGGGDHAILPTVVGYGMRGAREKTHQIIGGGFQKMLGKTSKITVVPLSNKL